jgi:anaerobic magnesium-protoporphyrin IX monomethyl ester cyclase
MEKAMEEDVGQKTLSSPDLLLLFPPQWSPFQPPLSLPSLRAWLRRAGYDIKCVDLNIEFFYWLLSDECAAILHEMLATRDWPQEKKLAYAALIDSAPQYRSDLDQLHVQEGNSELKITEYVTRDFLAAHSLDTYLSVISDVCQDFKISAYEFHLPKGNLNTTHIEKFVTSPPSLLKAFVEHAVKKFIFPTGAKMYGLSCIGQEQMIFSLLLGARLKSEQETPIIVGGTIFSRIFERGNLLPGWFAKYFDVVVRHEGEAPTEQLLKNLREGRSLTQDVTGIVFAEDNTIKASPNSPPLRPGALPIPDFDDLPLGRYLSAELTLPILSARGCYWGKCEFCHHGMVYGEKYEAYQVEEVYQTVEFLAARYGAHLFAFNDEAIPPKILRQISKQFPSHSVTGWNFTGLVKFEKYFTAEDFCGIYDVGFRSLYVGLESGSERVLALMRKNNTQATMLKNLSDATHAGIWMHCFVFFGFPGETEADAQETYDFIMGNTEIIGSVGCGTFSLEHNAPIYKHYMDFGLSLKVLNKNDLDVYYNYEVNQGIDAAQAEAWADKLNSTIDEVDHFRGGNWIPREHLLCLLSLMTPKTLLAESLRIIDAKTPLAEVPLHRLFTAHEVDAAEGEWLLVNRLNRRVVKASGTYGDLLVELLSEDCSISFIEEHYPSARLLFANCSKEISTTSLPQF